MSVAVPWYTSPNSPRSMNLCERERCVCEQSKGMMWRGGEGRGGEGRGGEGRGGEGGGEGRGGERGGEGRGGEGKALTSPA